MFGLRLDPARGAKGVFCLARLLGIHSLMQLTAGSWVSARTRHEPHRDRHILLVQSSSTRQER
jgi:hypothetical protein